MADLKERALASVLAAADWYCNHQVNYEKPYYDANQGRFLYNYHMPTKKVVWGLQWTMARGIMVLLGAYELTENEKYLKSAGLAGEYLRTLQIFDAREPRWFGAIREEIPQSWHVDVRDLFDSVSALMFLYRITGHEDYLYRAKLAASWVLANALDRTGWPAFWFDFYEDKVRWENKFYGGAGAHCYYYLYKATGFSHWLERGFLPLAEGLINRYFDWDRGCVIVGSEDAHHGTADGAEPGVAVNDDGCGQTLLMAHHLLGEDRWLEAAVRYGKYLICQQPVEQRAALALRCLYLYDLSRVTKEGRFADWASAHIETLLALQERESADVMAKGGFRGEDEDTKWYSGGKPDEYIVARTTAYAVLALMRLHGKITGPYYGWERWDIEVDAPAWQPQLFAKTHES